MDYRYYYDNREEAGHAGRDTARKVAQAVAAGGAAVTVAALGQGMGLVEAQTVALTGSLMGLALLRPTARLLRSGAPRLRIAATS